MPEYLLDAVKRITSRKSTEQQVREILDINLARPYWVGIHPFPESVTIPDFQLSHDEILVVDYHISPKLESDDIQLCHLRDLHAHIAALGDCLDAKGSFYQKGGYQISIDASNDYNTGISFMALKLLNTREPISEPGYFYAGTESITLITLFPELLDLMDISAPRFQIKTENQVSQLAFSASEKTVYEEEKPYQNTFIPIVRLLGNCK